MSATCITIVFLPYHVGLRDYSVGDGPNRLRKLSLIARLQDFEITVLYRRKYSQLMTTRAR
ncbi:hypothetical protein T440DRAFT_466220 [Plenodomus tracheiphilus IPT5]|uniref:Uncharacterized protein n=1 Tax=Plenodomus tracheiphilus IPT5 TaxID=1408161 RepID=A0A6A7BCV1_9PLEO|nr:hypothetical protein T440DRAFT_466220 [Plenodomus tracheiphilus IPT5]